MTRKELAETRERLAGLSVVLLVAFGLIALAAAYWTIVRGPTILARSDNPRQVEEELAIHRGAIMDVNLQPLAVTANVDGELRRDYPLPQAAPAVGYYSLRYGTAGVEEAFDAYLRGESEDQWSDWWRTEILGEPQTGRDLRLTIDSRWQAQADALLGDRNGAVLLFSLPDVTIQAMASSPGHDPNALDADFEALVADEEAPLLNRVTQGQYQPGLLLQPFLTAVAAGEDIIDLDQTADDAAAPVVVDGMRLTCPASEDEPELTWARALQAQCPGPMLALGRQLGEEWFLGAMEAFGLTGRPSLLTMPGDAEPPRIDDVGLAAIGQDQMAISPLQVGVALAALANDGQLKPAQLVAASQDDLGEWTAIQPADPVGQAIPARVADDILSAFEQEEGILGRAVTVLSGPEGEMNSWYIGLAPAADPRYGVVVVVENDRATSTASMIGRDLLKSVLDPEQD